MLLFDHVLILCFSVGLFVNIFIKITGYTTPMPQPEPSPCDITDFEIMVESPGFVDKSMLIKEFLEGPPRILITAPHEFGKTINLDMIRRFMALQNNTAQNKTVESSESSEEGNLTDDCKIFQRHNLKIYENKDFFYEHCGQYPVIYLDFIDILVYEFDELLNSLKYVIYLAFRQHSYMITDVGGGKWIWTNDRMGNHDVEKFLIFFQIEKYGIMTEMDMKKSFFYLSDVVHTYHNKKVAIIIDEFDAVWLKSINQVDSKLKMAVEFYTRVIFVLLASNHHIHRVFLSACMHYGSMVILQKVQAVQPFEFGHDHRYAKYYGFTSDEVKTLLKKFDVPDEFEDVQHWYNGYTVKGQNLKMFNPWSVEHYLHYGVLKCYWNGFAYIHNLRKIVLNHAIRQWMTGIVHDKYVILTLYRNVTPHRYPLEDMKTVIGHPALISRLDSHWNTFFRYLYECRNVVLYKEVDISKTEIGVTVPNNECVQKIFMYLYSSRYYKKHFKLKRIRRFAFLDSFDALCSYADPKTTFKNFTETLARLYTYARLPEDDYAFGFCFYHMFRLSKMFRLVDVEVSKMIGPSRNVDLTVIREDGTAIIMETKYVNGSAKACLLRMISSGYFRILNRRPDYRNLTANNCSKIYMGVFLNDNKFVEVCYLVNSISHRDIVCLSSTRNLGIPQIPVASTEIGSDFYIPLSGIHEERLTAKRTDPLLEGNYTAMLKFLAQNRTFNYPISNVTKPFQNYDPNFIESIANILRRNVSFNSNPFQNYKPKFTDPNISQKNFSFNPNSFL